MTTRLVVAVVSTLLQETVLAAIVLFGLPSVGIEIPLAGLITVMVVWAAFAVFLYQMGSRALRKKPLVGLPDMIGSKGKASSLLALEGFVRIKGELWEAKSVAGEIETGERVTVVGQDGMKLVVRKSGAGD
ncbi:NfeD family protein [Chloroflexota bacterium]